MKLITFIKKSCYLILYLFVFLNNGNFSAFAVDVIDIQNNLRKNSSNNFSLNNEVEEINDQYILDSGDILFLAFIGLDIF